MAATKKKSAGQKKRTPKQPVGRAPAFAGVYEVHRSQSALEDWQAIQLELDKKTEDYLGRIAKEPAKTRELNQKYRAEVEEFGRRLQTLQLLSEEALGKALTAEDKQRLDEVLNGTQPHLAYVMSIDIRRSTELMLKARTPELFARFLSELYEILSRIVKKSRGVFDRFTGDGILVFFPLFYSGESADRGVLQAAIDCHEAFADHYKKHRSSFSPVPLDAGLGIGIDFGPVHFTSLKDAPTGVGAAVVYACRLSGAPAHETLLNQAAFERLSTCDSSRFSFIESELLIKNEGRILAYRLSSNR